MENSVQVDWFVGRYQEHRDQMARDVTRSMDSFFAKFLNDLAMLNGSTQMTSNGSLRAIINQLIGQPSEDGTHNSNTKNTLTTTIDQVPETVNDNLSASKSSNSPTASTSKAQTTSQQLSQKSLPFKKRKFDYASLETDAIENSTSSKKSVCTRKKIKIASKCSNENSMNKNESESEEIQFLTKKSPSQRTNGPPWFCSNSSCILMFVTKKAFDCHLKTHK